MDIFNHTAHTLTTFTLIAEIVRPFKPMFTVSVAAIVDDITDEEGPYLSVELTNSLPTVII